MIRAEESVDVRAAAEETFAYLSAIDRYPEWLPGLIEAEQTAGGSLAVGTTFRVRVAGPAGPVDATGEVTELDAPRKLAVRADSGPGGVAGGFELEALDDGTRIRVWMEVELRGMYRFAEGLAAGQLRASLPGVLERLRSRLDR